MLEFIIKIIMLIIAAEAITEIVVKSELFEPIRKFCFESNYSALRFIHRLLDCGYCFSVWAAFFVVLLNYLTYNYIVEIFVLGLVVHRLANVTHFIIDRVRKQ